MNSESEGTAVPGPLLIIGLQHQGWRVPTGIDHQHMSLPQSRVISG